MSFFFSNSNTGRLVLLKYCLIGTGADLEKYPKAPQRKIKEIKKNRVKTITKKRKEVEKSKQKIERKKSQEYTYTYIHHHIADVTEKAI